MKYISNIACYVDIPSHTRQFSHQESRPSRIKVAKTRHRSDPGIGWILLQYETYYSSEIRADINLAELLDNPWEEDSKLKIRWPGAAESFQPERKTPVQSERVQAERSKIEEARFMRSNLKFAINICDVQQNVEIDIPHAAPSVCPGTKGVGIFLFILHAKRA